MRVSVLRTLPFVGLVAAASLVGDIRAEEAPAPFDPQKVGFTVQARGEEIPYRVLALSVMPGETLPLQIAGAPAGASFSVTAAGGRMMRIHTRYWEWRAPGETGLYPIRVTREDTGERMTLNAFVIVPIGRVKNGMLNGYRIGDYPSTALKGLAIYRPPRGFIEVTPENEDTEVAPHFKLAQFLCKQAGGYPKYLVLQERLLLKLELLLQQVNAAGIRCDTFLVMSGYRTPFYNHAIGNVKYSRHVWGGAADIYVDASPQDGNMDDLNGDGRIDVEDAGVLYDLIDGNYGKPFYAGYVGGLGRYKKTAAHPPFVHVDVRGFRARWGR